MTTTVEKLLESAAIANALFHQSRFGVVISDKDGNLIQANEKFCRLLGYAEDELRELGWVNITRPDALPYDMEAIKRTQTSPCKGYVMAKHYIDSNGKDLPVTVTVHKLNGGMVSSALYVVVVEPEEKVDNPHIIEYFK